MDEKKGAFLALIDLSAAFDLVDHRILLNFLSDTIGIKHTPLNFFKSYLEGRTQQVSINDVLSDNTELQDGVRRALIWGLSNSVLTLEIFYLC